MARRQSRTTWAAVALAGAITAPYLGIFVQSVRAAVNPSSVPEELLRDLALLGASTMGDEAWIGFSYLAAAVGAVTLVVLLVIAGLVARRQAAREAAFAVFGAMGLVAGLAGTGGLIGGSWSSGSWLAGITFLACLGVVILLALESTATDFELAAMERRRRREGDPRRDNPPG